MITSIDIKNFKCLADTKRLKIRPLTFCVGPNSSGKSSLLKILLMLKQTIDSTDLDNPLVTNGGWIEMGAYPEFVFMGDTEKNIEIDIGFDLSNSFDGKYLLRRYSESLQKFNLKVIFSYNRDTTQIELVTREINSEDNSVKEKIVYDRSTDKYNLHYLNRLESDQFDAEIKPIKFHSYRPIIIQMIEIFICESVALRHLIWDTMWNAFLKIFTI